MADRLCRVCLPTPYVNHKPSWNWYRNKAILKTYYGDLILFSKPIKSTMPEVAIVTAKSSPKLLGLMNSVAPEIRVSSVEYAVDLITKDYTSVAGIFWVFRRNVFFPRWNGEIQFIGTSFDGWDDAPKINRVHKVRRAGSGRTVKVYERGPDRLKCKNGNDPPLWWREDLDRVRVEVTVGRTDMIGGAKVLGSLADFLENPRISEVIDRHIHFRCFKGSNVLPGESDCYAALDDSGYDQCFQAEYREAKELVQNPAQYLHEVASMKRLRKKMLKAAKKADRDWKNGTAKPIR